MVHEQAKVDGEAKRSTEQPCLPKLTNYRERTFGIFTNRQRNPTIAILAVDFPTNSFKSETAREESGVSYKNERRTPFFLDSWAHSELLRFTVNRTVLVLPSAVSSLLTIVAHL
jgi:hypothetical protein